MPFLLLPAVEVAAVVEVAAFVRRSCGRCAGADEGSGRAAGRVVRGDAGPNHRSRAAVSPASPGPSDQTTWPSGRISRVPHGGVRASTAPARSFGGQRRRQAHPVRPGLRQGAQFLPSGLVARREEQQPLPRAQQREGGGRAVAGDRCAPGGAQAQHRAVAGARFVAHVEARDGRGEVGAYVLVPGEFREDLPDGVDLGAAEQQQRLGPDVALDRLSDGVPLLVVAVEQLLAAVSVQQRGQLPAQVEGVLEAEVEGLAADGHLLVRGVPGEQEPAAAVVRGLAGGVAEGVDPQRGAGADVLAGDALPGVGDVLEGGRSGAGCAPEFVDHDAGDPVGAPGGDDQALLQAFEAAGRYVDALDVGAQQFPAGVGAGELEAAEAPYGAVLAVAADGVRAPYGQPGAVVGADVGDDPVRGGGQPGQFVAAPDVGAEVGGPLPEHFFQAGLRDLPLARVGRGEAEVEGDPAEVADGVVRDVVQPFQQAAGVEDLHGAGVQGGGP